MAPPESPPLITPDESAFTRAREAMVATQIVARGIRDPQTLAAMREVPRHLFVAKSLAREAYEDHPLPIGHGQTISQPYIVAFVTEALGLTGGETVLEVGAGCGYQAAILSRVAGRVFALEIIDSLANEAMERAKALGFRNLRIRSGDGYAGWAEHAPFGAIVVNAAAPRVPEPLKEQLGEGGRLIVPIGDYAQELVMVTRHGSTFVERSLLDVRFVPMVGQVRGPSPHSTTP